MACWACLKFQCFFKTVIQNMHAEHQAQYMLISLGVVDIGFDINGGSLRVRQMILWLGKLKNASRAVAVRVYFTGGLLLCSA